MGSRIYSDYFGIPENAFSIPPDPRFLFMSERHCEALAHLLYGMVESGCFILLTGEVGTGKTTVCRALLEHLPENVDVALLLTPPRTWHELLLAIADELKIFINNRDASQRELVYVLTRRLLENYGQGRRTVVIIDEAQNIHPEVLEQVRLLTNLETHTDKLLHVFLVGQPELRDLLMQPSLRLVAQRITARYHLEPLTVGQTQDFVSHRLTVAGGRQRLFSNAPLQQIRHESKGMPRMINILCDRALRWTFVNDLSHVGKEQIRRAAHEWRGALSTWQHKRKWRHYLLPATAAGFLLTIALVVSLSSHSVTDYVTSGMLPFEYPSPQAVVESPPAIQAPSEFSLNSPSPAQPVEESSAVGKIRPDVIHKQDPVAEPVTYIGPGSPPEAVRWLRQRLGKMDGVVRDVNNPVYDNHLRERIMDLQHKHGLVMDGIAGPLTLKYLNGANDASTEPSSPEPKPRT